MPSRSHVSATRFSHSLSLTATWGPTVSLMAFLQSPVHLICSSHQPSALILAHAVPRTSGRVALGCPTPPRCQGLHLRARGAHFCAVADRFRATPLPSPTGRCTMMPGPSNMPTSPSGQPHAVRSCRVCTCACAGAIRRCARCHVQLPPSCVSFT
jgi:hypothetical protein